MVGGGILDLPFPGGCVACGRPGEPWCPRCESGVAVLVPPGCARCGRPFPRPVPRCASCPPRPLGRIWAPFGFEGPVREALLALKFGGRRGLASPLGAAMAAAWDGGSDLITWVPLSSRRLAERGYDQAEALARAVARRLGLPARRLLVRTRDTPPQAKRGRSERRRALRGAFAPAGPMLDPRRRGPGPGTVDRARPHVLLVDDVLTTGSTAVECARVLRRAGAASVDALVAARTIAGPLPPECYDRAWMPTGSVVARRSSPKVDASRRRNDPRKATLGR